MIDSNLITKEFQGLIEDYYNAEEIAETLDSIMCEWLMYRLSLEESNNKTDAHMMNVIKTVRDSFKNLAKNTK